MSRVRNATEFRKRYDDVLSDYTHRYKPMLDKKRKQYVSQKEDQDPIFVSAEIAKHDEVSEWQTRKYFIDGLLLALNWTLDWSLQDGLPNLVPELAVVSSERGTRRFLDYLGLDRDDDKPLLVVEAKRANAKLPRRREPVVQDLREYSSDESRFIISEGLQGKPLIGEWNAWLDSLRDYVRSLNEQSGCVPNRVVITNSEWLVVFIDPTNAFLSDSGPDSNRVLVFRDRYDVRTRYSEIFDQLEYTSVAGGLPALTVGQLPFDVGAEIIDRVMHGVRLLHGKEPGFAGSSPLIKVQPIILLRTRPGTWVRVDEPSDKSEFALPKRNTELEGHLFDVKQEAESLLARVNSALGTCLPPTALSDHYHNDDGLADLPGVAETGHREGEQCSEYLVVTGSCTHFLLPQPSVADCPYHDWTECKKQGVESEPSPVVKPSVGKPHSFYISGDRHHCAHRQVADGKSSQVTSANPDWCGPRSAEEGDAFCEVWSFEEYLCCRACVFEDVCTRASAFNLPCQASSSI